MRYLTAIPILIAWIPHVMKAVALFESVLDPKLSPSEKKTMVLTYLSSLSDKLNLPWGEAAIEVVSDLIDTVVGVFKWMGQFRSKNDMTPQELEAASAAAALTTPIAQANAAQVVQQDEALANFLNRMSN